MNLIKKGRRILVENGYTFVALKKDEIYSSTLHGIKPLMSKIFVSNDYFKDYVVIDRVIGRAAALLLIRSKVKYIHGFILSEPAKDLLEQYPEIKEKIITLQPKNVYFTKQLECLFENNDGVSDFIEYKLKQRKDYLRNKNIHIIKNELTKETMKCQVFDYYVIIEASKKSNIFLDILYQISKSYVIMDEQVRSLEV